ncbi:hypothetical protein [Streptomyces sp. or20]|uniref:hypothetical protein n=1 Tax=Streptomyces sp. or20 TaxID=1828016 RepID=UPI000BF14A73|nr:hypothetical protein [Streptomyces sp. or20]
MSTTRRALGTGPTTTTRSTSSPRLLPAERVEQLDVDERLVLVEHSDPPGEKRRRTLGPGHEVPQ